MGSRVDRHISHALVGRLHPLPDRNRSFVHGMGSLRPRCNHLHGAKLEVVTEDGATDNAGNRGGGSHGEEGQVDGPGASGLRAAAWRWANEAPVGPQ